MSLRRLGLRGRALLKKLLTVREGVMGDRLLSSSWERDGKIGE